MAFDGGDICGGCCEVAVVSDQVASCPPSRPFFSALFGRSVHTIRM